MVRVVSVVSIVVIYDISVVPIWLPTHVGTLGNCPLWSGASTGLASFTPLSREINWVRAYPPSGRRSDFPGPTRLFVRSCTQ